jgi:hypothetical protein
MDLMMHVVVVVAVAVAVVDHKMVIQLQKKIILK